MWEIELKGMYEGKLQTYVAKNIDADTMGAAIDKAATKVYREVPTMEIDEVKIINRPNDIWS